MSLFEDELWKVFGKLGLDQTTEIRSIVKCLVCGQKNRLPNTNYVRGPLGPKCGRCKTPL